MMRITRRALSGSFNALILAAILLAPLAAANEACAGAAVWQETNFQYLWGGNFKSLETKTSKDNSRSTVTVEHAPGVSPPVYFDSPAVTPCSASRSAADR